VEGLLTGDRVYILAEIGMTHDGSLALAKALIKAAAACGVDGVKFQTHIAEAETLRDAPAPSYFTEEPRFEYFERTAFSLKDHRELKVFADENGVDFISSPFSIEAVELLEEVGVPMYKVPSGEVNNLPYLEAIGKTSKRILLSSGMSTWAEIDEALVTLRGSGCGDMVLMQCTSMYPCPPKFSGLNIMVEMQERYSLPIGFSDHTLGIGVALAAVSLGAVVIEKHFTLSKEMYGPDAKHSNTPEEFEALVRALREVETALSNKVDKDEMASQLSHMKVTFEKSIVSACELREGTVLQEKHLAYKKPGDGIPARRFREILGKRLGCRVKKDTQLDWSMFA
jgi:sialic acid synthase SpsE